MAQVKTNAMRLLDAKKISYEVMFYDSNDGKIDGLSVAEKIGRPAEEVYKTLVTQAGKNIYVFVIPVQEELDLKKAAKAAGEKKIDMLPVKDIQKWTGYIRGGCSPIGMKKQYKTFLDQKVNMLESVIVSGGKIGIQINLSVADLEQMSQAEIGDLTKNTD